MKFTLSILGLLLATSIFAQSEIDYREPLTYDDNGAVVFSKIMKFPDKSKSELFALGQEWFIKKFLFGSETMEIENEEIGKLMKRGYFPYRTNSIMQELNGELTHIISISIKDGKIKVDLEELYIVGPVTIITAVDQVYFPRSAHDVFGDDALYKRNGKARKVRRRHKEAVLKYWYDTLNSIQSFMASAEDNADW